jgi:hypothetical protein
LLAGLTAAAVFLYLRFNYMTKKLIVEQEKTEFDFVNGAIGNESQSL